MTLSGWEAVFFWIFSIAAIFAGLLTVMARNAVHSALFLISSLVSVAALFVLAGAEFIAGVQILVYVGGVMVLFLFVIMLVNVGAEERGNQPTMNKPRQVTVSMVFCLLLVLGLLFAVNVGYRGLQKRNPAPLVQEQNQTLPPGATGTSRITTDTQRVGNSLYRYAALPFEIASVLLLVAIIGSVMLARTLKQEAAVDDLAPEVLAAETVREPELAEVVPATDDLA
ncbi:MAG TPA: NADH-quinone oxidoreductase subunit J [Pyrinomonadaceae bacterium]|nr:NADH-quinone oxidoreductase subunit J [Pyrinomonadaceae bacterium]